MRTRSLVISSIIMLLLTSFAAWSIGLIAFCNLVKNTDTSQQMMKTDAIVILTGGSNRISAGLDMMKAGMSKQVFISGVNEKVTLNQILSLWPEYDGSDLRCCITLDYAAQDTKDNATEALKWIRSRHVQSFRLVTSDYHIMRALMEFTRLMPEKGIFPSPVASTSAEYAAKGGYMKLMVGEYHKTILTWLRMALRPSEKRVY